MHCISSDLCIAFHQIYLHSTFQIHQQGSKFTVPRSPWGTVTFSPEMRSREKSAGPEASHLVTGPGQTVFLCELAQLSAWGAQLLPVQNLVLFPHIHREPGPRHPQSGQSHTPTRGKHGQPALTWGLRMAGRGVLGCAAASSPFTVLQTRSEHLCALFSLPWASLVTQRVKRLPAMQETRVRFLGREDPLEKEIAPHSSTLAWQIPWMEKPGRLQSMGSQRVRHDWATSLSFFLFHLQSHPRFPWGFPGGR